MYRDSCPPACRALLNGPSQQWVEELAALTLDYGISGFTLATNDAGSIEVFAADVAPQRGNASPPSALAGNGA